MKTMLTVSLATLMAACTSAPAKPPTLTAAASPMKLPADATEIDFTLVSGNAYSTSTRSRSIAVGDAEVVLGASGLYGESTRSREWWTETRALLDDGLANADACTEPENATCGFELRVTTPRGEERLHGCCTERAAYKVEAAFERIVPSR